MLDIISINEKNLNYLHSYEIEYKNKDGENRIWELVSRKDLQRLKYEILENKSFSDGTMIFATDLSKEKVCLIKEYRVSAGRYVYGLPAGLLENGEDIKTSAIREFKEETGLDLEYISHSKSRYTSIGITNEKVDIVYGYFSGKIDYSFQEADEDIEVIIADKNKVIEILENEEVGIRSALLLEYFFNLNKFMSNK